MRIKELHLQNFRCFEELTIKFPTNYTVFIGNNGAGKSSILNALQIALGIFIGISQQDVRQFDYESTYKEIDDDDARLKTTSTGSTFNQEAQYPVIIGVEAESSDKQLISWKRELQAFSLKRNIDTNNILYYLRKLQKGITNDKNVIAPLIVYYGTRRQWDKNDSKPENNILFLPQMNGYVNALSAKPFNIEVMRHWFSRMLLIARKKPVPEFEAVRNAISSSCKTFSSGSLKSSPQISKSSSNGTSFSNFFLLLRKYIKISLRVIDIIQA